MKSSKDPKKPKKPKIEIPGGLILVKHRNPEERARIRHDVTIDRYWVSKQTGEQVEVRRFILVDGQDPRVIYHHPVYDREFSCPLAKFKELYQTYGNVSSKY